ncbi:uncharacterized protein CDV56_104433 [Aspergillus thermomutatus]|uniref:Uncharacterized protein n=1 Tax=Aspergillus thermomutatus TaxID=41047 RepID=A0A397GW37_ASPTH|nr:uncharacterized protein CDV56_104433 [Aspergillus thermomutatus]RHZ54847.1 hypothetical protein CDV56_104433 [Aspergillus thermomutatus]
MPLYTYQPEVPHGLPTISQAQAYPTPPDTPPNELERMIQELDHVFPSLSTDIVMEDETIDPMLIDQGPRQVWHRFFDLILAARDDRGLEEVIHYILSEYGIPIEELRYELVEAHGDGEEGFVPVAKVIAREPNLHGVWHDACDSIYNSLVRRGLEEFHVVIEYRGPKEQAAGEEQGGVTELWNQLLSLIHQRTDGRDDLLVDCFQIGGDNSATSCLAVVDTAGRDIFALQFDNGQIVGGRSRL